MTSTVVVRSASGVLFEMDVPAAGHALELWNEKLAKGDLVLVDSPVEWVADPDGTRRLIDSTTPAEAPSVSPDAPRRGRPPKVQAIAEPAVEADPVEEE